MAFRKKVVEPEPVAEDEVPRSLISSAVKINFSDASYNNYRFRDETWQRELWRLYDITPELRFAANWIGSACSKVDIFVAEVDKLGRIQGRAKEKKIAALSDTIFGGPVARAEAIRAGAINLTVAGEFYILGTTAKDSDKWFVLSSSEIRRTKQGSIYWGDRKYEEQLVDLAKSMVTRVWTPHPSRIWCADSPARSCQAVLRELEQLTKLEFAEIDSRLAGAGLLIMPNNLDFPLEDSAATQGESLMMRFAQSMGASLKGEGTAAALVPIVLEAAPEDVDGFKHMTFATELTKQAVELRQEAIRRLSLGMDIAPEILTGQGDMNHWSSWFVDEATVKIHVEPLMNRICDALSTAYLTPALKSMGEDPKRFVYSFDTGPLTIRPQRLQDALNLFDKDMVSAEAVRVAGYFKESDKPSIEETTTKFLMELMLRDPNLFMQAGLRELIGITAEMLPPESLTAPVPGGIGGQTDGGGGPPPPPPPPSSIIDSGVNPTPEGLGAPPSQLPPGGTPPGSTGDLQSIQASSTPFDPGQQAVLAVANATVLRGLEIAGGKLLDRHNRGLHGSTPKHELHTKIRARDSLHAASLLEGAWTHLPALGGQFTLDTNRLKATLTRYCMTLLLEGIPHEAKNLLPMLINDGHLDGRQS